MTPSKKPRHESPKQEELSSLIMATKTNSTISGATNGKSQDVEDVRVDEPRMEPQMDSGLVPWTQCIASGCLWMGTWGIANSFGVFQTYYEGRFPHQSASSISWIGSLQLALLISLALIVGPIFDAGYLRSLVWVGCAISVLAMMLTSACTQYWQLVLAQGLLLGIGNGCLIIPSFAVIPQYFVKKRSLAIGVAAAGSALGGVIFPIIFHQLQPKIGFGWTVRVLAFIMLAIFILPVLALRLRSRPPAVRRMFDVQAWKEKPFFFTGVSYFFMYLGTYIPAFYIQLYALDKNIVNPTLAFYLLPLLNAGSLFGRIIPPHIADKIGVYNTSIICFMLTSIVGFTWTAVHNAAGVIIFVFIYGFFAGSVVSFTISLVICVTPNMSQFGVRLGMLFLPIAAGLLFGNPIAGALSANSWSALQVFTGAVLAVGTFALVFARLFLHGKEFVKK